LRRLLEPHAVACVARDRTDEDLGAMRAGLAVAEAAGEDVAAFHRGSEAFRNAWLGAVRNSELRHAIQRYSGQVQSVRFATLPDPRPAGRSSRGCAPCWTPLRRRTGLGHPT
jgi:DNA-binding GntR family transcriptional regulator